ncbi:MAG: hypothetical protein AAB592_01365 [Patescibacteria group bacterium]
MDSSENLQHIKKIAFVFFIITGLLHFLSGMMASSGYVMPISDQIARISFIPFFLSSLFYLHSHLKLSIGPQEKIGWVDYTFLSVGGILLIGLIWLEFTIPDANPY